MISAVILSHNDEHCIERTLQSLTFCDKRIVIDDFSTDHTVDLANKHKADVYRRHLHGDFAAQRNFGLSKATGEWVLFIDSDEVVSPVLAKEIQKATTIDCVGFFMHRRDTLFGKLLKHGETASVRLLRLGKKDAGLWQRPVHEVWNIEGITGTLVTPLDHFPHPNVAQFLDDINVYSTLNARYMFQQNLREPLWQIIGYPTAKFFINFFWRKGFLDGTPGAIVALMMSMHSFLTRAKLWLLRQKRKLT